MARSTTPDLNIMVKAAEKAARSLLRDFGEVENLQVSVKGPADFVSAADKRSEEIIHDTLRQARPSYSFLMEESGAVAGEDSEHTWVIDPLDGTFNFLHGLPHWCISIALVGPKGVQAGVIYDPIKDDLFTAERGGGAFHKRQRLRVSGRNHFGVSAIATGCPGRALQKHGAKFNREYVAVQNTGASLRRFGAAALDLAYVAAGRYDGFWERHLGAWDIAAGILLVKEAGGYATDIDTINADPLKTGAVVAANGEIYEDLKKIVKDA